MLLNARITEIGTVSGTIQDIRSTLIGVKGFAGRTEISTLPGFSFYVERRERHWRL